MVDDDPLLQILELLTKAANTANKTDVPKIEESHDLNSTDKDVPISSTDASDTSDDPLLDILMLLSGQNDGKKCDVNIIVNINKTADKFQLPPVCENEVIYDLAILRYLISVYDEGENSDFETYKRKSSANGNTKYDITVIEKEHYVTKITIYGDRGENNANLVEYIKFFFSERKLARNLPKEVSEFVNEKLGNQLIGKEYYKALFGKNSKISGGKGTVSIPSFPHHKPYPRIKIKPLNLFTIAWAFIAFCVFAFSLYATNLMIRRRIINNSPIHTVIACLCISTILLTTLWLLSTLS